MLNRQVKEVRLPLHVLSAADYLWEHLHERSVEPLQVGISFPILPCLFKGTSQTPHTYTNMHAHISILKMQSYEANIYRIKEEITIIIGNFCIPFSIIGRTASRAWSLSQLLRRLRWEDPMSPQNSQIPSEIKTETQSKREKTAG